MSPTVTPPRATDTCRPGSTHGSSPLSLGRQLEESVAWQESQGIVREHEIHSLEVEAGAADDELTVVYTGTDTVTQGGRQEITRYTEDYHLVEVDGAWKIDATSPPVPTD